ncbi:MAG: hypothetical protein P4L50_07700 [Anaerolineaceae bacterium]|nr:hypothetical protein [Anaerolineaceae bacterium]
MTVTSMGPDHEVVIEIGGIPIALQTSDREFTGILKDRYGDYMRSGVGSDFTFRVELISPGTFDPEADAEVWLKDGEWRFERGDFRATWNQESRHGLIRQSANPYSIDSVLRITHTLLLARTWGFLLHASSAVRNGKAFLFSGLSEAGKTTIARLAPPDVALLTDEASYVRRVADQYRAYGTPFAGELGKPGRNISAPIAAVYLLEKAQQNQIVLMDPAESIRRLMRNILFFAHDPELVRMVFESACAFVAAVPVYRLSFFPDERVWDLIG